MLGRTLPSGQEAIAFHNTLFRVSELCWVKAYRLSRVELGVKITAGILAIVWFFAMARAKDDYANIEFLLAIFPLALAWTTSGSLKLGCSGDFEEAYEGRKGLQSSVFLSWIEAIRQKESQWLHFRGDNYDLLLNPNRIAWVRPCFQVKFFPLVVSAIFVGYLYLVGKGFNFKSYPVLEDFKVLTFDSNPSLVKFLCYLLIGLGIVAFGLSIKRSVEICGTGGVQDVFSLPLDGQTELFKAVSGEASRGQSSKTASSDRSITKSAAGAKSVLTVEASPANSPSVVASVEAAPPQGEK